jgi:hypothetical protein
LEHPQQLLQNEKIKTDKRVNLARPNDAARLMKPPQHGSPSDGKRRNFTATPLLMIPHHTLVL